MRILLVEEDVRLAENVAAALREMVGFAGRLHLRWAEGRIVGGQSLLRPHHSGPDAASS